VLMCQNCGKTGKLNGRKPKLGSVDVLSWGKPVVKREISPVKTEFGQRRCTMGHNCGKSGKSQRRNTEIRQC
jgi:hypothetical protein